jgi:hypothetical protein
MKYGFAKILGSQESGYSGDKPNQRGKYLLVPKSCMQAFPALSERVLNDQTTLKCSLPDGNLIGLNVVYHNAKFFPSTHQRAHNEVRIYRNVEFETALNADRYVLIVFLPIENEAIGSYAVFSISPSDPAFIQWKMFDRKIFTLKDVAGLPLYQEALDSAKSNANTTVISNLTSVVQYVSRHRSQQQAATNDPALPLSPLIKTQAQFSDYLREMYNFQCCLRREALIDNKSCMGLDAAHIQPHAQGGPLLPTNGMLLSADLHRAFEAGAITLTQDCKIEVHDKVSNSSSLVGFENLEVAPHLFPEYRPHIAYIEHHRNNIFARFAG